MVKGEFISNQLSRIEAVRGMGPQPYPKRIDRSGLFLKREDRPESRSSKAVLCNHVRQQAKEAGALDGLSQLALFLG
jgi:hypothetical protein